MKKKEMRCLWINIVVIMIWLPEKELWWNRQGKDWSCWSLNQKDFSIFFLSESNDVLFHWFVHLDFFFTAIHKDGGTFVYKICIFPIYAVVVNNLYWYISLIYSFKNATSFTKSISTMQLEERLLINLDNNILKIDSCFFLSIRSSSAPHVFLYYDCWGKS